MHIQRVAAFSLGEEGGNPAGVVLVEKAVPEAEMARIAAEVGYSETAFAVASGDRNWRVRYFAPETEVPFCGHATIALGSVLGKTFGEGAYELVLNDAVITVEAEATPDGMMATLLSPPTESRPLSDQALREVMMLFGLDRDDLESRLPPAFIHGGADHIMVALRDRERLATMSYALGEGRELMGRHRAVTIMLVHIQEDRSFAVRNAFASGGVLEDPATGAAAAAFAGYLRDLGWPHGGRFVVHQGQDMGCPSLIRVQLDDVRGAPVRISGLTREIPVEI